MFTFKVSRFSFLPIRVWLSQIELRRLAALQRSRNLKILKRIDQMGEYLCEINGPLINNVRKLWEHFEVPNKSQQLVLGLGDALAPDTILKNAQLNFFLLEEYRHYNALLKKEQARTAEEKKSSLRLAPAWLRQESDRLERLSQRDKANWKTEWEFDDALGETDFFGAVISRFTLILQIIAMTAFLIIPMLVIMLQPDWCINLVASLLAGLAASLKLSFTTLYASFAVAVFILIVLGIVFIVALLPFKPEPHLMLHELDERLQDRLAELAYMFVKDVGNKLDHLDKLEANSLEIDSLRQTLEEINLRLGIS
jgi:hypothetical protein